MSTSHVLPILNKWQEHAKTFSCTKTHGGVSFFISAANTVKRVFHDVVDRLQFLAWQSRSARPPASVSDPQTAASARICIANAVAALGRPLAGVQMHVKVVPGSAEIAMTTGLSLFARGAKYYGS
jgi:hypothetical protein